MTNKDVAKLLDSLANNFQVTDIKIYPSLGEVSLSVK